MATSSIDVATSMCGDSPLSSFLFALIETTQPLCINGFPSLHAFG